MSTGTPLYTFRFELSFVEEQLKGQGQGSSLKLGASFAECTGLEATMEPKVIRAGGQNWGAVQRVGPVTFATVVLKRGISHNSQLFYWFQRVAQGDYGLRCTVRIALKAPPKEVTGTEATALTWKLERALPIKFKAADFNARATEVGIEELHLAHEGLSLDGGQ